MNRKRFLSEKVVELILRVFASKEDDISNRIKMIKDTIAAARKMVADGVQVVRRIDVLVWAMHRSDHSKWRRRKTICCSRPHHTAGTLVAAHFKDGHQV